MDEAKFCHVSRPRVLTCRVPTQLRTERAASDDPMVLRHLPQAERCPQFYRQVAL